MRFLFVLQHAVLNTFAAPIRSLCDQGDEVSILAETPREIILDEQLDGGVQGLTIRFTEEELREDPDVALETGLRTWIDYLRYFEPELEEAMRYREQRGRMLPENLRTATDRTAEASPDLRRALSVGLRALERTMPVPRAVTALIEGERPDAVLVSPLMTRASQQVLYLRAARRLGIPSALCVASWDNLPSKGLIHELPDLVTVWNDAQRDEAVRLHGVPPDRVVVVGAPRFDRWFGHAPTESREEYCARLGLPPERPHILYVGSTRFKRSLDEGAWIARWVTSLRESGHPELREVPVVVRPHPKRSLHSDSKGARRLANTPGIVVHPPNGSEVMDEATLSEFYDSLHHAGAVVGINTSAMIEAAIVGRSVHVPLVKAYRSIQEDCPHFNHLRSVGGGLIVDTDDMEEHARGLARALRGEDAEDAAERARSFVASFIRPHGVDRPATPATVDALRALAQNGVTTKPETNDLAEELHSMLLPARPGRGARKAGRQRSGRKRRAEAEASPMVAGPGGSPKHERRKRRSA
jgi:phosphohistidine swiveling domain-containing protein